MTAQRCTQVCNSQQSVRMHKPRSSSFALSPVKLLAPDAASLLSWVGLSPFHAKAKFTQQQEQQADLPLRWHRQPRWLPGHVNARKQRAFCAHHARALGAQARRCSLPITSLPKMKPQCMPWLAPEELGRFNSHLCPSTAPQGYQGICTASCHDALFLAC